MKRERIELTDAFLRTLKPPKEGKREIEDARAPLMVRITAANFGWYPSRRPRTTTGRRPNPRLGTWPSTGLAEARKRAYAHQGQIQGGGDPVGERRAAKAASAARATLPTVADRLDEWQLAKADRWSHRHAAEVARIVGRDIVPVLGTAPLQETTRKQWVDLVTRKRASAPAMAALMYRIIASFLNDAEARGWLAAPLLPRKGVATLAPAPAARERVLTDAELVAIWQASEALNPKPRCYVRLSILTGARREEVANIPVGEVDRDASRWTIPAARAKNERPITLPLCRLAMAELTAVWPDHATGPRWRMLGDIPGNGLSGFSKLKSRVDELSGVHDWRWHDLRRTMRTGLARLGISRDIAELAINHISGRSALIRTYDLHDYRSEILAVVQCWQAHVTGLVTDLPSADVVPMRRSVA